MLLLRYAIHGNRYLRDVLHHGKSWKHDSWCLLVDHNVRYHISGVMTSSPAMGAEVRSCRLMLLSLDLPQARHVCVREADAAAPCTPRLAPSRPTERTSGSAREEKLVAPARGIDGTVDSNAKNKKTYTNPQVYISL